MCRAALLSENIATALCYVVMLSPTKATSDRNNKSEKLDDGKLAYILCRNLSPDTEPKLTGDHGQGAGVTSLSEVWKQYKEDQTDMFIML